MPPTKQPVQRADVNPLELQLLAAVLAAAAAIAFSKVDTEHPLSHLETLSSVDGS
jgi:hypothetical protein